MFKALFSRICKIFIAERPTPTPICGPAPTMAPYARWVGVENAMGIPIRGYVFTKTRSDMHNRATQYLQDVLMDFDVATKWKPELEYAHVPLSDPLVQQLLYTIRKRWSTSYQPNRHYDPVVGLLLIFSHNIEPTLVFSFRATDYPSVELVIDRLIADGYLSKGHRTIVDTVKTDIPRTQFEPEQRGASAMMPRIKPRPMESSAPRGQGASAMRLNITHRNADRSNDYHMVDTNMLHQRNLAMFHDSCDDNPTPIYTPSFSSRCDDTPSSRDDSPSYDSGSSGCGSD